MGKFPHILLFAFFSSNWNLAQAQISADTIASHCQSDSGNPRDNYLKYGEKLALTLSQLSPEQIARVFGAAKTVTLGPGDSLNDALDLDNIEFAKLSSDLPPSAADALGSIAEYLTTNPDAKIKVEGHVSVDFQGAQNLSEARAQSTKDFLISLGIDSSRIETEGKGYTEPIEGANRSENQRVEFILQ